MESLSEDLRRLGIKAGDRLFVHSEAAVDALAELVKER